MALSFIQRPEDLAEARKIARGRALLMSKIEKPQAVARLAEIIELSDALMVARGDLGVEMPLEAVPGIQKQITRAARRAGKPVVVATQMLESMITAPVPTRAEVSDVSIAVFEGADAIMLSAESAAGAVSGRGGGDDEPHRHQGRDRTRLYAGIINAQRSEPEATGADAISLAAREIAETLKLAAIVTYTASGTTGLRAARERPQVPIIALSPILDTARRLSLLWGTHCVVTPDASDLDDMVDRACRIAHEEGFGKPGDRIIITAGVPLRTPGSTNMLRIAYIGAGREASVDPERGIGSQRRKLLRGASSRRRLLVDAAPAPKRVAGDARFDAARQRLKVARLARNLFDRRDDQVGRDPVRLVAEILDPDQFRARNVALQADRMDLLIDDRVVVAGDHHGRRRDLLVARRHSRSRKR